MQDQSALQHYSAGRGGADNDKPEKGAQRFYRQNLLEYSFPKDAYLEGGAQPFMYETLQSKLLDEEKVDNFLNAIVEKVEYVSTYTIFMAHCTYSCAEKNKMDEFEDEADTDYNFIVTALCPVNLRIDGLVYDEQDNSIAKKESCDRIVELPSDGFLFPLFNDRAPDINGVLYYTKKRKKTEHFRCGRASWL